MALSESLDDEPEAEPVAEPVAVSRKPRWLRKALIAAGLIGLSGVVGTLYESGIIGAGTSRPPEKGSIDLPEIVANLNAGNHRTAFVRLKARLELANKADEPSAKAAQPRLQDLFQTYLRDMRPEELRGSAGTYRLREELTARANIALAPAHVTDILFVEMLTQ